MIKEFKIHSNYLIDGANVKVSWKTKDALFIKFHIDSWTKGWLNNNDSINLNLNRDVKKITLYAIGINKLEKKEIIIELDKLRDLTIRGKKIKKNEFESKKYMIKTFTKFSLSNSINRLKRNDFKLKNKEIKPKINYNKLKLENHE
tara:strand:- start:1425 stop:1862 length:438 start_codon:yes stop_codon:yes gene_type:complete